MPKIYAVPPGLSVSEDNLFTVLVLRYCTRKEGMEKLTLMGKIGGIRERGRQRVKFLQRITEWNGKSVIELMRCIESRNDWHKLIVNFI